jgi:hypothetical protein
MISVAIQGYGVVIWNRHGEWRAFSDSPSRSAVLSTRVDQALSEIRQAGARDEGRETDESVCSALLSISGAHLLAVDCGHHAPAEDRRHPD